MFQLSFVSCTHNYGPSYVVIINPRRMREGYVLALICYSFVLLYCSNQRLPAVERRSHRHESDGDKGSYMI